MKEHVHLSPEDLLEVVLAEAPSATAAWAELRACPACSREFDALSEDVLRVRGVLGASSHDDQRRALDLAQGVLERTTREDLSWRGDWREIERFMRGRWSKSKSVRLVAASLILHLLALPVLAIALVLQVRDSRPPYTLSYEPPSNVLPQSQGPYEPLREIVREPEPDAPGPLSADSDDPAEQRDRLERAGRVLLEQAAPREVPSGIRDSGPAARIGGLLNLRSRRIGGAALDADLGEPAADASGIEHALWTELLLDDWAMGGQADPRLGAALARLRSMAVSALGQHATARAASYGYPWPAEPLTGGIPGPALDKAWFAALEQACADLPQGTTNGAIAAWLAWGREQ